MRAEIDRFLSSRAIAVVGVSSSRMKFGTVAYRTLKSKGYRVYGVNPVLGAIDGDTCYGGLSDLPDKVEAVFVAVKPEKLTDLVSELARMGVRRVWFQQGADYASLATQTSEAGIETVQEKCLLMYAEPVGGIHRLHRFLAKLFGRY